MFHLYNHSCFFLVLRLITYIYTRKMHKLNSFFSFSVNLTNSFKIQITTECLSKEEVTKISSLVLEIIKMVLQEDAETETFHRHQALPLMVLRPRNGGQVVPNKSQTKLGSIVKHDQKSKAFIQEFYNNYYVPKYIRVHYIHSMETSRIYLLL